MSPLLTIRRELQGDLCERNLSHNPHLKTLDEIHNRPTISDSSGSEISEESALLLALLQWWASLCTVAASNSDSLEAWVSEASFGAWTGKNKGWMGFDKKEWRPEKLQREDRHDLNVGSSSLLSEKVGVDLPLSGCPEGPCRDLILFRKLNPRKILDMPIAYRKLYRYSRWGMQQHLT